MKHIIYKIFFILALASIIHIPILNVARIYVVVWFIVGLLFFFYHRKVTYELFHIKWLILPLFLLAHIISLLYTHNLSKGLFDIEVKLSFLVLPFLFYLFSTNFLHSISVTKMKRLYLISTSLIVLFLAFRAIYQYVNTKQIASFYYNELSAIYHPSYLAMYITLSVIFLLEMWFNKNSIRQGLWFIVWMLFFLVFQYFLSSKAGILVTSIVLFLGSLYAMLTRRIFQKTLVTIVISGVFLYLGIHDNYRFQPVSQSIQSAEQNVQTTESNAVRILVWEAGLDLIAKHWLVGVGCGDVKDVLLDEYAKRNMQGAIERKLNLHNQYLETWLSIGIVGIMLLLILLLYPFFKAWQTRDLSWLLFIVAVSLNFLTESMLNTQAGVIFIAYFYCFFIVASKLNKS